MKNVTLGTTGITVPQNAFGCLPIQRCSTEEAVSLLRKAYAGGMRLFDTAHNYTDSEKKVGLAFEGYKRDEIYLTTKTHALDVKTFWEELEQSLQLLKTDYIDIYQFHQASQCYKPGDGTGMYEAMLEAKKQGKIKHIGITAHKVEIAIEAAQSGLYECVQFPFSYLSTARDIELVNICKANNVGFIAMKGLSGGLIVNSKAAMAFMSTFDNILPIWGIQRDSELDEWLSYFAEMPVYDNEMEKFVAKEKLELAGDFCRGCGYCLPCPQGIMINNCARMIQMIRRAPSAAQLSPKMQEEMFKIDTCLECYQCASRCPYELDTPKLLKKNLEDYRKILAGEIKV